MYLKISKYKIYEFLLYYLYSSLLPLALKKNQELMQQYLESAVSKAAG